MALRPDRNIGDGADTSIDYFMNQTATRGRIVIHASTGLATGVALDDANALVAVPTVANSSEAPAGLLLNDVVNLDLTRQHLNSYKDEVQLGNKVTLLKRGWVVTDAISGTPAQGDTAYWYGDGQLTPTQLDSRPAVGRFLSAKDSDGYAKVQINID
jgi:hypothetical protein